MKYLFRIATVCMVLIPPQWGWCLTLSVQIEGLNDKLRAHVADYLDISREQSRDDLSPARLQRLHNKAPDQIKTALQVYGYYQASIKSSLVEEEDDNWLASYTIEPGEPVRISTIDITLDGEGRDNPAIAEKVKAFPLHRGDIFEHPRYEQARNAIFRAAIEQGFLDTEYVKREVQIDPGRNLAVITLHLETGQRYYFGPLQLQHDAMDESFLRRYVKFKEGEPYNPAKLLRLQTTLSDSGLFQLVEVRPNKREAVANRVPIDVKLTSRKRRQWRFGLGYATDTGARGSIHHSRIVGNEGDLFESKLLLSEKKNSLNLGYTIPLANPVTDQVGFGVRYIDETTTSRDSTITGLTASNTSAWGEWQRIISLNYEREVYTIPGEPQETRRILYPVLSVSRVRADNRLYTRHGSRIYAELRGANDNILSDTNFGQVRLGLKWIRGIGKNARVILRGDFGSTNVAYLDRLPASQRFFAGGDNSVRGYAYEELGPKNANGVVVGGKHLIVGSVELEHRLVGNWSAAVFYDVGNAVNSMGDKLAAGTGFGLRWNSPVGPVRFDFAWALDKPTDRFRLHVVIGPDL